MRIHRNDSETSYVGEWQFNKYHGKGQLNIKSESEGKKFYNGDFKSGMKNGHGELFWKPIEKEKIDATDEGLSQDGFVITNLANFCTIIVVNGKTTKCMERVTFT